MEESNTLILDRLLQASGLRRDSQLAELLGVTPQAVSQARRKGRIPEGWILKLATRLNLSTDWVFFGRGTPHLAAETPHLASTGGDQTKQKRPDTPPLSEHASLKKKSSLPAGPTLTSPPTLSGPSLTRYTEVPLPLKQGSAWEDNNPDAPNTPDIDMALVPLVGARLAAGQGSLETNADVQGYFAFRQDWLCRKGNPDRMVLMKVCGDSMEPDIRHGDMVLINQGHTQIYGHAIYAVGVNEEIYIKQVETRPGGLLFLRSLNPRYEPIEVSLHGDLEDAVRIIGRVIWWCREA